MFFHSLPLIVILALVIIFTSVGLQIFVNKAFKLNLLSDHASVIDPLLGVVGTLFSVLLGFMVGGAMDRYHDATVNVDLEANSIIDVFRLAQGYEEHDRKLVRGLCRSYVNNVVNLEWNQMANQKSPDGAFDSYQRLWEATLAVQPGDDERISNIQQTSIDAMKNLGENRRLRAVTSMHGLTFAQWLVIGVGAAITVMFTLFFPMRSPKFHNFLTGLVAVSLGLNIWLLAAYSTPFTGELQIQPYMFTYNATAAFKASDDAPRFMKKSAAAKAKSASDDEANTSSAKGTKSAAGTSTKDAANSSKASAQKNAKDDDD
jgi:hypothetical protein